MMLQDLEQKCRTIGREIGYTIADGMIARCREMIDLPVEVACVDLLYAHARHRFFYSVPLFQDCLISSLQEDHGYARVRAKELLQLVNHGVTSHFGRSSYWQSNEQFITYLIAETLAPKGVRLELSEIGNALFEAILDQLNREPSESFHDPDSLEGQIARVVPRFRAGHPWVAFERALMFAVEPLLPPAFVELGERHRYDWLLVCLVAIGEKRSVHIDKLIPILRHALASSMLDVSPEDLDRLVAALVEADLVFTTQEGRRAVVSLTDKGFRYTATVFADTWQVDQDEAFPSLFRCHETWQIAWVEVTLDQEPELVLRALAEAPVGGGFSQRVFEAISTSAVDRTWDAFRDAMSSPKIPKNGKQRVSEMFTTCQDLQAVRLFRERVLESPARQGAIDMTHDG